MVSWRRRGVVVLLYYQDSNRPSFNAKISKICIQLTLRRAPVLGAKTYVTTQIRYFNSIYLTEDRTIISLFKTLYTVKYRSYSLIGVLQYDFILFHFDDIIVKVKIHHGLLTIFWYSGS